MFGVSVPFSPILTVIFFTVLSSLYLNIYPEKKNPKSSFAIISHNLRLSSSQRIIFKWTVKSQGLEGCLDAA